MTLKPCETIPTWWPDHPPIYDITKSWEENANEGPFFDGEVPDRPYSNKEQWIDFLGFPVASPIGIAAGPLLNAKWVKFAGALGFDIVTYKTIRSHAHPAHPVPNVIYIDTPPQFDLEHLPSHLSPRSTTPESLKQLAITNSFGNPSFDHDFLSKDIPTGNASLREGQVQIVSIFGSSIQDFVDTACLAKECGANIIEVNFSCPNLTEEGGQLYTNPDLVFRISSAIVNSTGGIPLIVKVGAMPDKQTMYQTLISAARAGARAVCAINTISMQVLDNEGNPSLGPNRRNSGICGAPIRKTALSFVQQAREFIENEKLDLTIMGVGGVTKPKHFTEFLNAGADIVLTATGMMWDPYLAMRYHLKENKNDCYSF